MIKVTTTTDPICFAVVMTYHLLHTCPEHLALHIKLDLLIPWGSRHLIMWLDPSLFGIPKERDIGNLRNSQFCLPECTGSRNILLSIHNLPLHLFSLLLSSYKVVKTSLCDTLVPCFGRSWSLKDRIIDTVIAFGFLRVMYVVDLRPECTLERIHSLVIKLLSLKSFYFLLLVLCPYSVPLCYVACGVFFNLLLFRSVSLRSEGKLLQFPFQTLLNYHCPLSLQFVILLHG